MTRDRPGLGGPRPATAAPERARESGGADGHRPPALARAGETDRGAFPACLLERLIGRPAATWSADDLAALAVERGIRMVSLVHVGGDGTLKTLDFVPGSPAHLHDVLTGGERADGSSVFPGLGIPAGASDVLLRPRCGRAFLDPFAPLPTLAVLCGHAARDGTPLPQSPDTIVHAAAARLERETGVTLHALGEIEFFLGRRAGEEDVGSGNDRGYHATAPFVFGEDLRRRALAHLAEMGVPIKYAHSEVGAIGPSEAEGVVWEQHEIELGLAPLPEAADAVVLTHWVLRNLARRDGLRCSFDPILRRGHAGTGLHFHLSPVRGGVHQDVREADGSLAEPARWLVAGLVQMGAALMGFGNRSEDSFVRLSQAREAPSAIVWGEADRSALVRLPVIATSPDGRRVSPPTLEFRLPDGSAHPHLLLAGVAQSMLHGRATREIDALLERTAAGARRPESGAKAPIPRGFPAVAEALVRHRAALEQGGVFPAGLIDQLVDRLER